MPAVSFGGRAAGLRAVLFGGTLLLAAGAAACQELYPPPLVHTPANHPAEHVLLVDVEGLHAADLARYVHLHPQSALAALSARGVTFTDAHTPVPDPYAGLLALVTGGGPISTGITGTAGWDRDLVPPGGACTPGRSGAGAVLPMLNPDAEAAIAENFASTRWPLDPAHGCMPTPPHTALRVNTLFQAVHGKRGRTAFAGDLAGKVDLMRGHDGDGLDDACVLRDSGFGSAGVGAGDDRRVAVVKGWIDGLDCAGKAAPFPVLGGLVLRSVAAAQADPGTGYADSAGTPNAKLAEGLDRVDRNVGAIVQELKAKKLYDATWIVVTSSYGSGAMGRTVRGENLAPISATAGVGDPRKVALATGGGVVRIWLRDPHDAGAAVAALEKNAAALGIASIATAVKLDLSNNPGVTDPRVPDLVLQPMPGVVWNAGSSPEGLVFGGSSDDETHVAMLVAGRQLGGRLDKTPVPTTQLAPLLMRVLGMEKFDLDALHHEHTPALPGIF